MHIENTSHLFQYVCVCVYVSFFWPLCVCLSFGMCVWYTCGLCVCVHVSFFWPVYVYMYVCVFLLASVYACMCLSFGLCVCVYIYIYIYIYICVSFLWLLCVCVYTWLKGSPTVECLLSLSRCSTTDSTLHFMNTRLQHLFLQLNRLIWQH